MCLAPRDECSWSRLIKTGISNFICEGSVSQVTQWDIRKSQLGVSGKDFFFLIESSQSQKESLLLSSLPFCWESCHVKIMILEALQPWGKCSSQRTAENYLDCESLPWSFLFLYLWMWEKYVSKLITNVHSVALISLQTCKVRAAQVGWSNEGKSHVQLSSLLCPPFSLHSVKLEGRSLGQDRHEFRQSLSLWCVQQGQQFYEPIMNLRTNEITGNVLSPQTQQTRVSVWTYQNPLQKRHSW